MSGLEYRTSKRTCKACKRVGDTIEKQQLDGMSEAFWRVIAARTQLALDVEAFFLNAYPASSSEEPYNLQLTNDPTN